MTSVKRRLALLLAFLLLAGLIAWGISFWMDTGRHYFHPKNLGVVVPDRVWRSGQIHPRLVEGVLREHEIELILDLTYDQPHDPEAMGEAAVARDLGIRKVDLVTLEGDGTGNPLDYVVALQELVRARDEDRRVLIHCAGGSERTGGIVACYRMLFQGWDGARAYEEYLSYRHKPPETDVLERYVAEHLPEITRRLQASGHLPRVPDPLPRFGPKEGPR